MFRVARKGALSLIEIFIPRGVELFVSVWLLFVNFLYVMDAMFLADGSI